MNLNDLKRKHNSMQADARSCYKWLEDISREIEALREKIRKLEGDDFDPVPLIFGGDLHIYPDGEDREV